MLWISDWLVRFAEQMEFVVLAWFVLIETDSPLLLGLYAALRYSGNLFAPFFGIAVDRFDRKGILTSVRASFGIIALSFLLLAIADSLQIWQVFIFVGFSGMGRSLDNIARQSTLPDLVARDTLTNAVAMTSNGRNVAQIIGPIVGGVLLSRLGMAWALAMIMTAYLIGIAFVFPVRLPSRTPTGIGISIWRNLLQTGGYIKKHDVVVGLLLMALLTNITALPLSEGLMPVFAKDILGTDSTGLGALLSAYSAGAFAGSAIIAFIPLLRVPGRVIIFASLIWHAILLLFAMSGWFGASMAILIIGGLGQSLTMVTMSILLLSATSPEFRGRVMGVRSLAVYGLPMGLLISGAIADFYGAPTAIVLNMTIGIGLTALIAVRFKGLWRAREDA